MDICNYDNFKITFLVISFVISDLFYCLILQFLQLSLQAISWLSFRVFFSKMPADSPIFHVRFRR